MDDIVAPPTATQDAIPALADDLLKDRIRQFLEFLDDEVSLRDGRWRVLARRLMCVYAFGSLRGMITTTGTPLSGCWIGMRIG